MNDPYQVLGLTPEADELQVRQRYLELVRAFPPEQAPDRFAAIRAAYDELRDPRRRLREELFGHKGDSIEGLARELRDRLRDPRLPLSCLLRLAEAR
jgi:curved DNA-binding protein CbpA